MSAPALSAFVESIRVSGLLGARVLEQLAAWVAAPDADPQAIARALVQNGWLTGFQVKMFWAGRGPELFLGQYVLVERLGEGGMGTVYKARHRRMERDVALKVIRRERLNNREAVRRFRQEIQAAARLAHENVVMAYDADQAGDVHFFAMEYVEGPTLSRLVHERGALPVRDACDFIRQAALGLQHAHEMGMVHRDIKPSNLLFSKSGRVKILDMGLARLQTPPEAQGQTRLTQEGLVMGTPDFLAPEQARSAHWADIRSDLYALGCTFYFLLAAQPPYPDGTLTEKLVQHCVDPPPDLSRIRVGIPPAILGVLRRLMAKRPEDRFQTPAEVARALEPFCHERAASRALPVVVSPMPVPLAEPATDSAFRLSDVGALAPLAREAGRFRHHGLVAAAVGVAALLMVTAAVIWAMSPWK